MIASRPTAELPPAEVADPPAPPLVAGQRIARRLAALGIDVGALFSLTAISILVSGVVAGGLVMLVCLATGRDFDFAPTQSYEGALAATLVLVMLYFILFEWLHGSTVGKRLLRIRVVMADGRPCDLRAAVLRCLGGIVDVLFCGIVALLVMKPPLYQRFGDRVAGTVVAADDAPWIRRARPRWRFFLAIGVVFVLLGLANAAFMLVDLRLE